MANGNNISRESNAELLRLVCMFMIVLGHLITKGAYPEIFMEGGVGIRSIGSFSFLFIEGLVIVAVNVFVLISGYYGINFSLKKFFSLYFICAFYGLLDYLLQKTQLNEPIGWGIIRSTFFPFFHSPYWFITCYVGLLCFAPVLNYFIRNSSKREFIIIVALSSFINVWLGFFGHNQLLNVDGYNFVHFLYIYILGGTIRRFHTIQKTTQYRISCIGLYLISAFIICALSCFQNHWGAFNYNSPFVIIGALSLFCFSMSFSFHSTTINWLATSAISVYLIHMAPSIKNVLFRNIGHLSTGSYSIRDFLLFSMIAASVTVLCCFFDKIRILLMKPIWTLYGKIEKKLSRIQKCFNI